MIQIKRLIELEDFPQYIYVSRNQRTDQGFNQSIITAQTGYLREILGAQLYSSLVTNYEITKNVVSTTQVGTSTEIELSSVSNISRNMRFEFEGLPTSAPDDIGNFVVNGTRYVISNIVGNTITIDANSTGATNIFNVGTAINFLTPSNLSLYREILPYLVFQSYQIYAAQSTIKDTPSGLKVKDNDYSERLDNSTLGGFSHMLNSSLEVYKENLIKFLSDNRKTYDWRVTEAKADNATSKVLGIKNKAKFFKDAGYYR